MAGTESTENFRSKIEPKFQTRGEQEVSDKAAIKITGGIEDNAGFFGPRCCCYECELRVNLPAWPAAIASAAAISTATAAATTRTTTAAATAAAESTTSTATAAKSGAVGFGTGFVDSELSAVKRAAVELCHRRFRLRVVGHFHKSEPARLAAITIPHNVYILNCAEVCESRTEAFFIRLETHVAHIDIFHVDLFKSWQKG